MIDKEHKCPICGGDEFSEIPVVQEGGPESYRVDESLVATRRGGLVANLWEGGSVSSSVSARVCHNCGHIDFFDFGVTNRVKENRETLLPLIEDLRGRINALDDNSFIEGIKAEQKEAAEELKAISLKLKSDEITVREQKELQIAEKNLKEHLEVLSMREKKAHDAHKAIEQMEAQLNQLETLYSAAGGYKLKEDPQKNPFGY